MHFPKILLVLCFMLSGCAAGSGTNVEASLAVAEAINPADSAGFARATEVRPFEFPRDHGPHQAYQIEWWYWTGNLQAEQGRDFGYQFTIFRRALTPEMVERDSEWGTNNIYLAHLALTDIASGQHYAFERFSRDGAELAGASGEPFRVFLEDWRVEGQGPEGMEMHIQADAGEIALDLRLVSSKPVVLQGDNGLSAKGGELGNASYYYSLTRMLTSGYLRIGDERLAITGTSWMDHEWSTSVLAEGVVGWDWFSLQLDDQREIMFFQLRHSDGQTSPFNAGSLVFADGEVQRLAATDVEIETLDFWQSPQSGATYPIAWRMSFPQIDLNLEIRARIAAQEMPTSIVYWEGAVAVTGAQAGQPISGHGYVELTGYTETGRGRQ